MRNPLAVLADGRCAATCCSCAACPAAVLPTQLPLEPRSPLASLLVAPVTPPLALQLAAPLAHQLAAPPDTAAGCPMGPLAAAGPCGPLVSTPAATAAGLLHDRTPCRQCRLPLHAIQGLLRALIAPSALLPATCRRSCAEASCCRPSSSSQLGRPPDGSPAALPGCPCCGAGPPALPWPAAPRAAVASSGAKLRRAFLAGRNLQRHPGCCSFARHYRCPPPYANIPDRGELISRPAPARFCAAQGAGCPAASAKLPRSLLRALQPAASPLLRLRSPSARVRPRPRTTLVAGRAPPARLLRLTPSRRPLPAWVPPRAFRAASWAAGPLRAPPARVHAAPRRATAPHANQRVAASSSGVPSPFPSSMVIYCSDTMLDS